MKLTAECVLTRDEDGRWTAELPQYGGAATSGRTREEALATAREVLELGAVDMLADGRRAPGCAHVAEVAVLTVEVSPADAERAHYVTKAQAAERLGVSRPRVSALVASGVLETGEFDGRELVLLESVSHGRVGLRRPMLKMYEAVLYPEAGGYGVEIPDLGVATWGGCLDEAAAMAYDAMAGACAVMLSMGGALPATTWGHRAPNGGYVLALCAEVGADMPEVEWMDVSDASDVLQVSPERVRAMARDGVLGARKLGGQWQVSAASVRERQANPPGSGRPRHGAM